MKLIGSKIERETRESLFRSRLISSKKNGVDVRLIEVLNGYNPDWKAAYFLSHTPDQGTDFYTILCDKHSVMHIEVDRIEISKLPQIETNHINAYRKGLRGKPQNLRLIIALELLDG